MSLILKKLAKRFAKILSASVYPTCRGCQTANPYAEADSPDNTFFCNSCKALGLKDPLVKEVVSEEPDFEIAVPKTLRETGWEPLLIETLKQLKSTYPNLKTFTRPTWVRATWEMAYDNYLDELRGLTVDERVKSYDELESLSQKIVNDNQHIFETFKGTGIRMNWDEFFKQYQ